MAVNLSRRQIGRGWQLTAVGHVPAIEFEKALLGVVSVDGWEHPMLWDFAGVLDLAGMDMSQCVDFAERNLLQLGVPGRIAILAPGPELQEAALRCRSHFSDAIRRQMLVVTTPAAAAGWLDGLEEPVEL